MDIKSIAKGQQVRVFHETGFSEIATVDSVIDRDFPAVYVTYADRTTGRVSPSQIQAA